MSNAFQLSSVLKSDLQVLNKVKEMGLLGGIALDVYEIICNNPGKTVGEIYELYVKKNPNTTRHRNELAKRVNDLRNWGCISVVGQTVICGYSGREANIWTATGQLPVKASKEVTLKLPVGYNNENTEVQVYRSNLPVSVSENDRQLAVRVLSGLRFQSSVLSTMSRILFFVPGLRQKNQEVQKALQIALNVLKG